MYRSLVHSFVRFFYATHSNISVLFGGDSSHSQTYTFHIRRVSVGLTPCIMWYHYWAGCGFSVSILNRDSLYMLLPCLLDSMCMFVRIIIFGCTFEWRTNRFRPNKVNYEDLCRGIFINGFNELHKISDWIWKANKSRCDAVRADSPCHGGIFELQFRALIIKNNEHLIQSFEIHCMP